MKHPMISKGTHPSNVNKMLTTKSRPHPATMKTPSGGTVVLFISLRRGWEGERENTQKSVITTVQINPIRLMIAIYLLVWMYS